jgi:2-polyprenyl-6-methoxyphenol hydroxylase-like FAD-dependent oxidoreductase
VTGNSDEEPLQIPVATVGGGPVGLVLALLLDKHGVRSVLFNTEETTRWHPKGSSQGARTMEHFRRLGIADNVRALGLPADHPTDVIYFTRFGGWELARLPMPSATEKLKAIAAAPKTDQVPEPLHRANQMYVEKFLLEHVRTRPNITVRFGWRVEDFIDDGGGVTLHVIRERDGKRETWRSVYLVGCDGGQGMVRRALGIRYAGQSLQQAYMGGRMFSTHVRVPTFARDFLRNDLGFQYWVVNPELRTTITSVNGADEFMFWTRAKDESAEADDSVVANAMRRSTNSNIAVEVLAHHPWTAGMALVAERYGAGRVFLAGDSVHLFTPTGGFGMNTGVDDAANLAWKLAAMVQDWGGSGLLASYEAERKPIALRNTGAARQLSKNIGDIAIPPAVEENSPIGEQARRELGAVLSTCGEQYGSIGVQLGARYDGSPIVAENGAPPSDDFINYTPSSVPGGRAPHFWLDDGRGFGSSLFDRLGPRFTLLRLGGKAPTASALAEATAQAEIPFTIVDCPDNEARDLYGCDLALIRPDQHVAWRGNVEPADPKRLLARVTGAYSWDQAHSE